MKNRRLYYPLFKITLFSFFLAACSADPVISTTPDTTPPVLAVSSPTNGQTLGQLYTVTGTVSDDNSGVAGVYVVAGSSAFVSADITGNTWQAVVNLSSDGIYTNKVFAYDKSGNCSENVVFFIAADGRPSIIITSPANGFITYESNITIHGQVSSEDNIALIQLKINDGDWLDVELNSSWSKNITLYDMVNTLTARVISKDVSIWEGDPVTIVRFDKPSGCVYISASGNDTNDGLSPLTPKLTLTSGFELAKTQTNSVIFIGGNFILTTNINSKHSGGYLSYASNIIITGGWNENFTEQGQPSVLNGNQVCRHVISIANSFNIALTNLFITGGKDNSINGFGGGIFLSNSSQCFIACLITNNYVNRYGGGIYISGNSNLINSFIFDNYAGNNGGGIYLSGKTNVISGTIENNTSGTGGGVYISTGAYNIFSGTISGNTGGGVYLNSGNYNTFSGNVTGNTKSGNGGGITIGGGYNIFSGSVTSNTAGDSGGGFYINASYNTFSGIILGNTAVNKGGGVFLSGTSNTFTFSSVIRYNHCGESYNGGAIYVSGTSWNIIQTGAVYSPNYRGSGTNVIDDLYGISAP